MTEEQIENEFENFTRDLRWKLIKNSIINEYGIRVSEEEIVTLARQIAVSQFQQYGYYQVQDEHLENYVKKILEKEEDKERIIRSIYEDKVMEFLKGKVNIVEKEVTSDEFRALVRTDGEQEE